MRLLNQLMQRFICCCSRQTKVQPERNSAKSQTMSTQWNYSELGPSQWHKHYPAAGGQRQSPIDIKFTEARRSDRLLANALRVNFGSVDGLSCINTGASVLLKVPDEATDNVVGGGPLLENYKLAQFHFHWGPGNEGGSEHLLDGQQFSAECHFVAWNMDLYSSAKEALSRERGLAVLGVFLQIGEETNPELKKVTSHIDSIKPKESQVTLPKQLNLSALLPDSGDYFTYSGSLTTPPCHESVTWIVYRHPISVSSCDMARMRGITGEDGQPIATNFRPVQDLNGRLICRNF
eukprot:m.36524 g.36524  ORF g.36524 m.36524 type:complete len:292 (+) comp32261_c0_seq6:75-950(+)